MCWNWLRSSSPSVERGVRLRVVGEVDELDRDARLGGGLLEGGPLGVALADDADLHDVVAAVLGPRPRAAQAARPTRSGAAARAARSLVVVRGHGGAFPFVWARAIEC